MSWILAEDQNNASNPPIPRGNSATRITEDVDTIRRYFAQNFGFHDASEPSGSVEKVLDEVSLDGVVKWMKSARCQNVITLSGAGISTCKYFYYLL